MHTPLPLSIAIPTYRRDDVLVATIDALLALQPAATELLVLDQSERHTGQAQAALQAFAAEGKIRWLRLPQPSITAAMNEGLRQASQDIVLFLDDDIRPDPELLASHVAAQARHADGLVAGRVIQPWQEGLTDSGAGPFHFASTRPAPLREFMGGNFSVRRSTALALGGFDENFVRVAYRFEAEFAHRWLASGRRIHFEPAACLHHLKVMDGGTRSYGDHLTTWRPDHAVGAYYYALRTGAWRELLVRPVRAVATRYHLRHPWAIPTTLLAELGGIAWALGLFLKGPRRMRATTEFPRG
jgi:GT2 family glycosyltransferase